MPQQLNFNVSGNPKDDVPMLVADNPPGGTTLHTRFEGVAGQPPNRWVAIVPAHVTGGATVTYRGTKTFRVIVPPNDGPDGQQWEAGLPPCIPPEYHGDAEKVSLKYDHPTPTPGLVSLSGRSWLLNGHPWNPLVKSFLWGLGGFMKGGAEKVRVGDNAEWMAAHGFDAVRILYEVDWTHQPYGGLIRGTSSALAEFLDWMFGDFGLRVKVTAQAGATRINEIGTEILAAVGPRKHTVLQLEGTNEQFATREDAVKLAKILMQSGLPTSVGWGTAGPIEVAAISHDAGVNVETLHLERTNPAARRDRQCWDFSRLKRAGDNGEFAGPSSSVASEDSPFHLAVQRIGGILMGAENYCLHTGSMVYGVTYPGPTGPRFANIWEVPNIAAIVSAIRNGDDVIGHQGTANWQHTNNPIPLEVVGAVDKQYYSISPAGDVVGILTDTKGPITFTENQPMAWHETRHPVTGEVVDPKTANLEAYVVRGHLA